jgi:hypothetical protein
MITFEQSLIMAANEVNYIRHLETVTLIMSDDARLNTTHVSLYLALFLMWNHNRFRNPISINRTELMKISKIGSQGTYHKCMTDLHKWSYIKYEPSHNPFKGSLIHMFNFCTSAEQVVKQPVEQLVEQVSDTYINSINKKKQIKQTNKGKGELHSPEKTKNSRAIPSPSKTRQRFVPPSLDEVKSFFLENKSDYIEAEKFFNHFESNGWLVGGRTKMKDWQAAARNWILRAKSYAEKSNPTLQRLNAKQNTKYDEPL